MARNNFYPSNGTTEPDMRQEMINTIDGSYPEIAKGQVYLLRKARRDSSGKIIPCPCVDEITREPDIDHYCPICQSEGYIWDETYLDIYKVVIKSDVGNAQREETINPGIMNIPVVTFFAKYDALLSREDKIVELKRDLEGIPVIPYKREYIYRINTLFDLRSDQGKLEFWKLDCYAEKRKFLNGPGG